MNLPPPLTDTSRDGLAAAIDADSIGARVVMGELPLEAHLDPDAAWALAPFPDPFRNVVVSARFSDASADRRIAELVDAFTEHETAFIWWVAPFHTPTDLAARLGAAGLVHYGNGPAMAVDLALVPDAVPPPEPPSDLEIRPVQNEADLRTYLAVLSRESETDHDGPPAFPPEAVEAIVKKVTPAIADEPAPFHYVGWRNGGPVATARLSLAGGAAGIYAIYTIPEARGRGIGAAMTLEPMLRARAIGYRIATLQSTEAGYRVYRRLGFETIFHYSIHGWLGSSSD